MAEFVSIQVTGAAALQAALERAVARLERPRDLMQALGDRLVGNIERRFDTKRDPQGVPWRALAASTGKRYAAEDKGSRRGTLLERTGRMRASLTANAGDDYVEVGMNRLTDGGRWQIPLLHETCRPLRTTDIVRRFARAPRVASSAYRVIGAGRPIQYPCPMSQPMACRAAYWISVSMPSATTLMSSARASASTAATTVVLLVFAPLSSSCTKARSIFRMRNGSECRELSEE